MKCLIFMHFLTKQKFINRRYRKRVVTFLHKVISGQENVKVFTLTTCAKIASQDILIKMF